MPDANAAPPRPNSLLGRVLTPDAEIEHALVRLREGRIESVEAWIGAPPDDTWEVGPGWIVPGFVDAQINGAFGQDFSNPSADLRAAALGLPASGVTAFVPTVVTLPWERYPAVLANLREQQVRGGAWPLGLHLEGPFLSPKHYGAHPPDLLREPRPEDLESLVAGGGVRMVTLAPELPGGLEAVRSLAKRGIVVSLGHSAADYDQARRALLNGARAGTHLFNAMRPLHHRDPNLAGALLTEREVTVGIIADGIHVHPAILSLAWRARGSAGLMLVTDAIGALGQPPGTYQLGAKVVQTTRHEARLADGTLAGSMLTMDAAVRTMAQRAGVPLAEAVAMASATPARLLGDQERGRIASGRRADLVVVGPDLRVRWTLVEGTVVFAAKGTIG